MLKNSVYYIICKYVILRCMRVNVDRQELERSTRRHLNCEQPLFASLSCCVVNIHDVVNIHHAGVVVACAKLCAFVVSQSVSLEYLS